MTKAEFDMLVATIRQMDIIQIMEPHIRYERRSVTRAYPRCIYHNDKKSGSLVLDNKINRFKCFSCEAHGDAIQLYRDIYSLTYGNAATALGRELGLLPHVSEAPTQAPKQLIKKAKKPLPKSYRKEKAPDSTLNTVYSFFLEELTLSPAHHTHLIERGMTEGEITEGKYASFPIGDIRREIMGKVIRKLWKEYGKEWEEVLEHTPGFHQRKREEGWFWTFAHADGIVIPIRNAKGEIRGLQLRREKEGKYGRYMWFSSAYAVDTGENTRKGTSSGSPLDIVTPHKLNDPRIVLTEGHFKAKAVARKWGFTAVSVQGVGNWRGILEDLKEIPQKRDQNIVVAFDADTQTKPQVRQHLDNVIHALEDEGYIVDGIDWDIADGNGIDDVIQNGKVHKIKKTIKNIEEARQ